eukprot:6381830-Lingulodinium_polyedra.AAC.1
MALRIGGDVPEALVEEVATWGSPSGQRGARAGVCAAAPALLCERCRLPSPVAPARSAPPSG